MSVQIGDKTTDTSGETPVTNYVGNADITGDIYGGSALGTVNTNTDNKTEVKLYSGKIIGNVYGGGFGQLKDETNNIDEAKADVKGNVTVLVDGIAMKVEKNSSNDDK